MKERKTIEKPVLTWSGGLVTVLLPQPTNNGRALQTEDAFSLITIEQTNFLPSTKSFEVLPRREYEAYLWREDIGGQYAKVPLSFEADSFSNVYFNFVYKRLIRLSMDTWGKLSIKSLLSSFAAKKNKGLESSLAAALDYGVKHGMFIKDGAKGSAKYGIAENWEQSSAKRPYGFEPSKTGQKAAQKRARALQGLSRLNH